MKKVGRNFIWTRKTYNKIDINVFNCYIYPDMNDKEVQDILDNVTYAIEIDLAKLKRQQAVIVMGDFNTNGLEIATLRFKGLGLKGLINQPTFFPTQKNF